MSKIQEYRKRSAKLATEQESANVNKLDQLTKLVINVHNRLKQTEDELYTFKQTAKMADWRSLAIMKLLDKAGITEDDVIKKAEDIQADSFDVESNKDDIANGLIPTNGPATLGMHAIVSLSASKGGLQVDELNVFRSKCTLGQENLLKEVDDAVIGMSIGETKEFPLDVQGKTDTGRVTLLGLRVSKPTEETETVQ